MRNKLFYKLICIVLFCSVMVVVYAENEESIQKDSIPKKDDHKPNIEMVRQTEKMVVVTPEPGFIYSYDTMRTGVIQHLDRDYTYDVIPEEITNGILFQGVHRLPVGTSLKIELFQPMTIFFFFHNTVDGGYSEIFSEMKGWERCDTAPQYDIHNGDHGLKMIMYKNNAREGTYLIPATIKDRACFNIVFKLNKE